MMFFLPHPFRKVQQRGVVVTKRGDCRDRDDFGRHFKKYDESGDIFAYALAEDLGTCTCEIKKSNSIEDNLCELQQIRREESG